MWIAYDNGRYAGKFLDIDRGHRLSLQYHERKHETLYLMTGRVKFALDNEKGELEEKVMEPGEVRVVAPGMKHRMEAVEDSRFLEFSSPELEDVVRLSDDYDRTG